MSLFKKKSLKKKPLNFNLLSQFKIRTKLLLVVAIMSSGIIALGVTGYNQSTQSEKALTSIYKNNLLKIQWLGDARTQLRLDYANLLQLLSKDDSSNKDEIISDLNNSKTYFDQFLRDYKKSELSPDESKQIALIEKNYIAWANVADKVAALSTSGNIAEAYKLFDSQGNTAFTDLNGSVSGLSIENIKKANDLYKKNQSDAQDTKNFLFLIIIIIAVVATVLNTLIIRSITSPIKKAVDLISKTADFNMVYDESANLYMKSKDEIGAIVRSVVEMRASLRKMVEKISAISNNLAASSEELSAASEESSKTINQVVTAINEIAEGNNSQAEKVNNTGNTLLKVSARISEVNKATSQSAETAVSSMAIISDGQCAVDVTAEKMAENVHVVGEVSASINELSEVIQKVSSMTQLINSIASQTNLLALNAAIEAARAGEAGRGFAVVADEIRSLAEGSSSAAKEIAEIVDETIGKNTAAAENMSRVKDIVSEQEAAVNTTKDAFEKIKLSVVGIADSVKTSSQMLEEIDEATKDISGHVQDMAAIAEESAASSEEISASSQEQLASVEMIAKASSDLSNMAADLSKDMSVFKL